MFVRNRANKLASASRSRGVLQDAIANFQVVADISPRECLRAPHA